MPTEVARETAMISAQRFDSGMDHQTDDPYCDRNPTATADGS
jgi:hypothetical protein